MHLAHDATVGEKHNSIRVRGGERIVRHHDDRLTQLRHRVPEKIEQIRART